MTHLLKIRYINFFFLRPIFFQKKITLYKIIYFVTSFLFIFATIAFAIIVITTNLWYTTLKILLHLISKTTKAENLSD